RNFSENLGALLRTSNRRFADDAPRIDKASIQLQTLTTAIQSTRRAMKPQKLAILSFTLILTALSSGAALAQSEGLTTPDRSTAASPFPFLDHLPAPTGAWEALGATAAQGDFKALLTFTSDGVVLADEPGGAFETTGHGNWTRNGYN